MFPYGLCRECTVLYRTVRNIYFVLQLCCRSARQGMYYGVPFGYTLFRSLLRIRPQGMNYGVPFGYTIILQE
ncbi:hypothetical protein EAI28_12415 [Faecalicatena contorta]|nr:hypothetical protein [Faecalicatena contorta]